MTCRLRSTIHLVGLAAVVFLAACGGYDGGESYPPPSVDEVAQGSTPAAAPGCVDGERRHCEQVYGAHAGIVNCFEGEATCIDGTWGDCVPTDATDDPAPE